MRQILLPIDPHDSAQTRYAVEQVLRLQQEGPVHVQLLRVQPRLSGHVAMCFGSDALLRMQLAQGKDDLALAQGLLDAAGVSHASAVRVGNRAETIAQAARDFGCYRIIFGREGMSLLERVFGSVAQQVRALLSTHSVFQVIGA